MSKKIKAGLEGYKKPTPEKVRKIIMFIKGVAGTIAISTAVSNYPFVALWTVVVAAVATEALRVFYEEEEQQENRSSGCENCTTCKTKEETL